MNRREFMMLGAASAVLPGLANGTAAAKRNDAIIKHDAPPRNRRPYSGLDWTKVQRVKTTSHGHCTNQKMLDAYLKRGFGLLTMSNYYPSAPYVPAAKMTAGYYRLHHEHPVMVNGTRTDGPFDWNQIISGWKDKLEPKVAKGFPLREGGKLFKPLPEGVLEAPNAEHHGFRLANGRAVQDAFARLPLRLRRVLGHGDRPNDCGDDLSRRRRRDDQPPVMDEARSRADAEDTRLGSARAGHRSDRGQRPQQRELLGLGAFHGTAVLRAFRAGLAHL